MKTDFFFLCFTDSSPLMSRMVLAAMAWCDGYIDPLLVPLNSWLQPPLPVQIKSEKLNTFLIHTYSSCFY